MTESSSSTGNSLSGISSDLFGDTGSLLQTKGEDPQLCLSRFEVAFYHTPPGLLEDSDRPETRETQAQGNTRSGKRRRGDSFFVTISHQVTSGVDDVGLQLWRGSLLLADYLLHAHRQHMRPQQESHCRGEDEDEEGGALPQLQLQGSTVVELGSGVGFLGVILSLLPCKKVYLTDMSEAITQLTERNIATNAHLATCSPLTLTQQGQGQGQEQEKPLPPEVRIRVLDWRNVSHCSGAPGGCADEHAALSGEGGRERGEQVVWLAADVIYDDQVTAHLFQALARCMRPGDRLFLALEKRFNFELSSLSVVAHGYSQFLRNINMEGHLSTSSSSSSSLSSSSPPLSPPPPSPSSTTSTRDEEQKQQEEQQEEGGAGERIRTASSDSSRGSRSPTRFSVSWGGSSLAPTDDDQEEENEEEEGQEQQQVVFRGARVPLDFPQAVLGYDRSTDMELWDISIELYDAHAQVTQAAAD